MRSSYHLEMCRKTRGKMGPSNSKVGKGGWRNLWNLNTPEVVKMFIWKVVSNSLPTRQNLARRKVVENSLCLVCGLE